MIIYEIKTLYRKKCNIIDKWYYVMVNIITKKYDINE